MIDRDARNRMISAIDDFMEDRLTERGLNSTLFTIHDETKDETIHLVADWIDEGFDCYSSKYISVNRYGWKLFNRCRLLLTSDAECTQIREIRWNWRQAVALAMLLGVCFGHYLLFGAGMPEIAIGIYFLATVVAFGLFFWNNCDQKRLGWQEEDGDAPSPLEMFPFQSFGQIFTLRKTVPSFSCKKFRRELEHRDQRTIWQKLGDFDIRIIPEAWEERLARCTAVMLFVFSLVVCFTVALPLTASILLLWLVFPLSRCRMELRHQDGSKPPSRGLVR